MGKRIFLSVLFVVIFFCIVFFGPRAIQKEQKEKQLVVSIINELEPKIIDSIIIDFESKNKDSVITDIRDIEEIIFGFKEAYPYKPGDGRLMGDKIKMTFVKADNSTIETLIYNNEYSALFFITAKPDFTYNSISDFYSSRVLKSKIEKFKK